MPDPLILVDLDDTLLDYQAEERAARDAVADRLARRHGLARDAFERGYSAAKRRLRAFDVQDPARATDKRSRLELALRHCELPATDAEVDGALTVYRAARLRALRPLRGAVPLLATLAARGRVVICTHGPHDDQLQRIRRAGLSGFVHDLRASGRLGVTKSRLLEFLGSYGDDPALMISDQLRPDVEEAVRIGLPSIWVAWDDPATPPDGARAAGDLNEVLEHSRNLLDGAP